ncbi:ferrochelatase [Halioglobus japonicus]|uniref:Ferrochelatase n=1 Tax=Halioglobus japonicus TaxID=930805 RepID=A0AAP8MER7_9GAMM|nr:ferrochelatase [Halioglobus japonicus]PLW86182.1 ferrochelatase [Halioglobus japonicus]
MEKSRTAVNYAQRPRIGVLLTNLGTPDAPDKAAVKRYLKEFLSDPRVVDLSRWQWVPILNGIILNTRPAKSAAAYATVWTEQGSPLMIHTQAQTNALSHIMSERHGDDVVVDFAMRYGNPSMASVVEKMLDAGVEKLLVLPLFPQYSGATVGSTSDALNDCLESRRSMPNLRFISGYHDNEDYIAALALSIKRYQAEHGVPKKLVFSYHGVPQRYCDEGEPYEQQCHRTTQLVVDLLGLTEDSYMTVFQSRFGREEWLRPYADETLADLPSQGVDSVQVICPGFSSDCLETIEEMGEENREVFIDNGGTSYGFIPCLNSGQDHVAALAHLIEDQLAGWL